MEHIIIRHVISMVNAYFISTTPDLKLHILHELPYPHFGGVKTIFRQPEIEQNVRRKNLISVSTLHGFPTQNKEIFETQFVVTLRNERMMGNTYSISKLYIFCLFKGLKM